MGKALDVLPKLAREIPHASVDVVFLDAVKTEYPDYWRIAKPLIAYRGLHGPFKTVADIRGCAVIDEALFLKLAPYLSVE